MLFGGKKVSKISNALSLLFYLNNHDGYLKIRNIADHLEIGEREVRRYRSDLEAAGFFIDNLTGRDGGYKLQQKIKFALGLTQTETLLLNLSARSNENVYQKLNSTLTLVSKMKQDMIIGDNFIEDETLYELVRIQTATQSLKMISISYLSVRYGEGTYLVAPYLIKILRNKYYLFAMHDGKLKSYDVGRITGIEESGDSYVIDQVVYDKEKNETAQGIYRGNTKYEVKIEVFGKMNGYVEGYFGNQIKIVEDKENSTTYSFETYNLHESLYTILSLASFVRILSPTELKKLYREELGKMQNINN
jgi:predicted DNA-binding transcriptional regulator YafY